MRSYAIAERLSVIQPSATVAVADKAMALCAEGHDIISLGAGEPDFDTPLHIKEAAIQAIRDGKTKYTAVDGASYLKTAIVNKFQRENSLKYTPKQIVVSNGAKQCIYNALQALINPGDEVIIPAPFWVSYPDMVKLAGGEPVILESDTTTGFKITAEQLRAAINPRTRMVILNSPSNPTGSVYSAKELTSLAQVLVKHPSIIILTDDIYEHILWSNEPFHTILNVCPELYEQTLIVNGVSKAYAMTGWRIGYMAGPEPIMNAVRKIQSQSTSCPSSISQVAATAALEGTQEPIKPMVDAFKRRHDLILQRLNAIPGVTMIPNQGTFYAFADMRGVIARRPELHDDIGLSNALIEAGVAVVPGSAFGAPGHVRLSYATSETLIITALERIALALA